MGVEQFGRTMKDIKPGALWGLCQILRLGISRCPALQLLEHNFPAQRQTIREHTETQMVYKHTQTHRQGPQTHKLYTRPPKKTLASTQQEHTHTNKYQYKLSSTKTKKDTDTQQSKTHKDALSGGTRVLAPVSMICLQQEGNALHGSRL